MNTTLFSSMKTTHITLHKYTELNKNRSNRWKPSTVSPESRRPAQKRDLSEPRCKPTTLDSRCGGMNFYRCATNHHKIFENLRQTHETMMLWDLSPTFTIRFMLVQDGLLLSSQSTGVCFVFMFSPSPFLCFCEHIRTVSAASWSCHHSLPTPTDLRPIKPSVKPRYKQSVYLTGPETFLYACYSSFLGRWGDNCL